MLTLSAEPRHVAGKHLKTLRDKGVVPAVLYGAGLKTEAIEINGREFEKVWRHAGEASLVELALGAAKKNVMIKEVQRDPLKGTPVHVDFYLVRMDKMIRVKIPLKFAGDAPAVKQGAILVKVIHELEVEALPANLPHELEVGMAKLATVGDRFLVSDLKLPAGVASIASPDDIIALVEAPKAEEEVVAEAAPGIADIEVVGEKGKKEEEGEAADGETEAKPKEPKKETKAK